MNKVTPFLMFNDQLEEAIAFYTATFPDSEIRTVARTGEGGPITSAEFVVGGQFFMGFNGGPHFSFSQGFSLFVNCKDQEEVDEYWNKLVSSGATPVQCGWITYDAPKNLDQPLRWKPALEKETGSGKNETDLHCGIEDEGGAGSDQR